VPWRPLMSKHRKPGARPLQRREHRRRPRCRGGPVGRRSGRRGKRRTSSSASPVHLFIRRDSVRWMICEQQRVDAGGGEGRRGCVRLTESRRTWFALSRAKCSGAKAGCCTRSAIRSTRAGVDSLSTSPPTQVRMADQDFRSLHRPLPVPRSLWQGNRRSGSASPRAGNPRPTPRFPRAGVSSAVPARITSSTRAVGIVPYGTSVSVSPLGSEDSIARGG
jgi:hypothetical protein